MFHIFQSLYNILLVIFCINFLFYCRTRFDQIYIVVRGIQCTNKLRNFDNRKAVDIPDFVNTHRNSEI